MKFPAKKILSLLALTALLFALAPATAAASPVCTAINDQILPLSDSTMPVRRGSVYYIPYHRFSEYLGLRATYSAASQTLIYYRGSSYLYFNVSTGETFDENDISYTLRAYQINGTIYVPVSLVCNKFSFSYSYISHTTPILRINATKPKLSDTSFVQLARGVIANMVYQYEHGQESTSDDPTPVTPSDDGTQTPATPSDDPTTTEDETEEGTLYPTRMLLTFDGVSADAAEQVLDALEDTTARAAFFLPSSVCAQHPDLVRRIVGQGHTLGFLLESADDPLGELEQANAQLAASVCTRTLVARTADGVALTTEQLSQLSQAGYRLWGWTLDSGDGDGATASAAYQRVIRHLAGAQGTPVLRLGLTGETATLVRRLTQELLGNGCTLLAPCDSDTPPTIRP